MLVLLFVRRELVHKSWAWLQLQLTWPARLTSVASRPQGGGVGLVVMGESHLSRPLLIHRISKGNAYQRQGGECLLADFACKLHPPGVPLPWQVMFAGSATYCWRRSPTFAALPIRLQTTPSSHGPTRKLAPTLHCPFRCACAGTGWSTCHRLACVMHVSGVGGGHCG